MLSERQNMSKILDHGIIEVDDEIVKNSNAIKYQNYQVNTPKKFQIGKLPETSFMKRLSEMVGVSDKIMDYVYFSVCKGAEPHIDLLDPLKFESRTFVIPVILPSGLSKITAENETKIVSLNHVYEFNHEKIHSMELEDTISGCVVIMVAVKKCN
jgi:hypothetical protein